jgi:hypothetical protein
VFNIHGVTVTAAALWGLHRPLSANQIYLMLVVWNGTKDVDLGSKQIEHTAASGSGCVHPILHPMRSRRTYFGFLAPVLAKQSPAVLDSINHYLPVVIVNGLAALLFMIGYALFGVAVIRTATPPRWAGVLVAVGASDPLAGFRDSSAGLDRRVADRDLGQCESWRRPRLARRSAVAHRPLRMCLWQISQHEHEHRIFGESRRETATQTSPRTGDHLPRVCRTRRSLFRGGCGPDGVGAGCAVAVRSTDTYRT